VLLRLFLLFTLVPFAELVLLIWIGEHTSWLVTLAMIILPGMLGAALARHQGLRCWRAVQEQIARGELPTASLLDGVMILVAAVLLITPGLLTDLTGLMLLVPPVRRFMQESIARRLRARVVVFSQSHMRPQTEEDEQIIDVEHQPPRGSQP
jgi:UPF0716 protein FxsA